MDLPTCTSLAPELWGRSYWEFLDAIVATFPKDNPSVEHRNAVYEMMRSLRILLPCPVCRKHYADFLQKNDLDRALFSRKSLVEFYFLLKKDVATRTNKNFLFRKPDEMWSSLARRLRLTKMAPMPQTVSTPTAPGKGRSFRIPTRKVLAPPKPKGCGCNKAP